MLTSMFENWKQREGWGKMLLQMILEENVRLALNGSKPRRIELAPLESVFILQASF